MNWICSHHSTKFNNLNSPGHYVYHQLSSLKDSIFYPWGVFLFYNCVFLCTNNGVSLYAALFLFYKPKHCVYSVVWTESLNVTQFNF